MLSSGKERQSIQRKVLIFENTFTLTNYLVEEWVKMAQESVRRQNRFTVALSGGRSPVEFYCKLSQLKDFDLWQRTHLFLGDERFVPLDSDQSNFKVIKENLLDYINIPTENIHPIATDTKNVELAADQYKNELHSFFEFKEIKWPRFDLVLLGIGVEGHTASLFPDDEHVDDPGRMVLPVSLPHLKHERVSLSLPVINHARNVFTLVVGASKADIIAEIVEKNLQVPASKINMTDGRLLYLLDKEAARRLPYRDSFSHEGQAVYYEFGKS